MIAILPFKSRSAMELRGFAPRSYRPWFNMTHVSCGITILLLMVARLIIRLKYP
ncbi:cytochrome b561, partial [Salmonella enterica subsp. enterica serovar Kentucky]|nr:cytochrome b561 [Salmonella enterica subsp. enterica serovar Kentucky]